MLRRKLAEKNMAADRFLIVCEGEKTEPNYFNIFKDKIKLKHRDSVFIKIEGEGKNTTSLMEVAIRLKNRAIPDYSQVWCVFDKDSFTDEQFNQACQMAETHDIQIAYSIESFELWYVLHFEYQQSALHRDQYTSKLETYLGEYEKNDPKIHDKIIQAGGSQERAISFAKRLSDSTNHLIFSRRNPSSSVYKLVEQLNRFV